MKTVVLAVVLVASGCAHVEIRPSRSDDTNGIRFFRPRPYLWITINQQGQCAPTIDYLPDMKTEYIIVPHTKWRIGAVSVGPTLTNGWNLTAFNAAVDTKVPETINAVAGLLEKSATAGKNAKDIQTLREGSLEVEKPEVRLSPGLYRLDFDKEGVIAGVSPIFHLVDKDGKPIVCPPLVKDGPPVAQPQPAPPK